VAVFIVDILANSVISSASLYEIRYEPLYLLALGAGLLSEKAYGVIRLRIDTAFAKYAKASPAKKTHTTQGPDGDPHQGPKAGA
jgi:hypothetical protein